MEENLCYILFDGNFPELSIIEFHYLLKGINPNFDFENIHHANETLILKINENYLKIVKIFQKYIRLVSLTKEIGLFYFLVKYNSTDSFDDILHKIMQQIESSYLNFKIDQNSTFKVEMIKRGVLNGDQFSSKNRQKLILSIADIFVDKFNLKANLKNEMLTITLILTPQNVILGQKLFRTNRKIIMNRTPSNRSYFHSGSMNPLLIRAMINIGLKNIYLPIERRTGKFFFLDPFMGAGGILMEAGTMGYSTIGVELGYWMSRGARMNLSDLHYSGYNSFFWSIIRCDSNKIPLKSNSIDVIVTDPPYGHSTILGGQNLEDLICKVLIECNRVLKEQSRMVISIPSYITIKFDGFKILEQIKDKVHSSLTRIIYLLEK